MSAVRRAAVLLLAGPAANGACPPGVAPAAFARALAEDVADLLADLPGLDPVLAAEPARVAEAEAVRWPDVPVLLIPDRAGAPMLLAVLAELAGRGYTEAAGGAPDVPDLPGLLVAKPFSALTGAQVAAGPAVRGGLVVLASRLPVPGWLAGLDVHLDCPDAVDRLLAAAGDPADLAVTPGWHRLRTPADLARLDPALEGWEATRRLLSGGG